MRVAFKDRMLAAGLDVEVEIDRDPSAARPARMRRIGAVAEKVPRRARLDLERPAFDPAADPPRPARRIACACKATRALPLL